VVAVFFVSRAGPGVWAALLWVVGFSDYCD